MNRRLDSLPRVGYWCQVPPGYDSDDGDSTLPDPRILADPTWDPAIRSQVASYLKKGRVNGQSMGYSYCRFHCSISDDGMGSHNFSDGVWVWPEGLAHYVEVHSVRLPTEFLDHIQQLEFQFPTHLATAAGLFEPYMTEEDWKASELYEAIIESSKGNVPPSPLEFTPVESIPIPAFYRDFAREIDKSNRSLAARLWHRLLGRWRGP